MLVGRLVIDSLLDRGVSAEQIIGAVRTPEKASDLAARGVQVREADYTRPETLVPALEGADRVLLISSGDTTDRFTQHANVIEAAKQTRPELLAFTSLLNADNTRMLLAADLRQAEQSIEASGLPYVHLRNGWYVENYTMAIEQVIQYGMADASGSGRFTPVGRADLARAAAVVLTDLAQTTNVAYELGGDETVTLADIATLLSDAIGQKITYTEIPVEAYTAMLMQFGLPETVARVLADASAAVARGELTTDSGDLRRLLGRPTTPVKDVIEQAVRAAALT